MRYHYNQFFYRAFTHSYMKTYGIDGINPGNLLPNGLPKEKPIIFNALYSPTNAVELTQAIKFANMNGVFAPSRLIASFFGIPNRLRLKDDKVKDAKIKDETDGTIFDPIRSLTLKSAALNLIDWPQGSEWQYSLNIPRWLNISLLILKSIVYGAWNFAQILPALAKNIIKLGTEFIPSVLAETCFYGIKTCLEMLNKPETSFAKKVLLVPAMGIAALAFIPFKAAHIVGRAITSPINSMYAAYAFGGKVVDFFANKLIPGIKNGEQEGKVRLAKKIIGGAFAVFSAALTVVAYTILFPLAIKAIATHIVPQLPSAIITIAEPIVTKLKPIFETIGTGIHAISTTFFASMGAISAHTGISLVAGSVLATIGAGLNLGKNLIKRKLQGKPPAIVAEKTDAPIADSAPSSASTYNPALGRFYAAGPSSVGISSSPPKEGLPRSKSTLDFSGTGFKSYYVPKADDSVPRADSSGSRSDSPEPRPISSSDSDSGLMFK